MQSTYQEDWITEEIKTANLGDARLNHRLGNVLDMCMKRPNDSIPIVANSWSETKAAYRFFDNDLVTQQKVLQPHIHATQERMKKETVVLLPQDTTSLDYSSKPATTGLGKLSYERQLGVFLHTTIAVTPERVCLGVVDLQIIARKELKKNKSIRSLPIEKKESMRWLSGYRLAQDLSQRLPNTMIVSVADRECDIYEIFVEAAGKQKSGKADWIIRSCYDRCLAEENVSEEPEQQKKLSEIVAGSPVLGTIEFELPRTPNRKARHVRQEIRAMNVLLEPPRRTGIKLPPVRINVVSAVEIEAEKEESPIRWLLLTSLPIDTNEEALRVIEWYLCRWQIEVFFRILKSGCKVEELQLQTLERLGPCLAMYTIIAWRILYMTVLCRASADMPCTGVFDDEEWQAAYIVTYRRRPPSEPPKLNEAIKVIASFGGFLNRKGDCDPGPKSIWVGLQRIRDFIIGIEALSSNQDTYSYWHDRTNARIGGALRNA